MLGLLLEQLKHEIAMTAKRKTIKAVQYQDSGNIRELVVFD